MPKPTLSYRAQVTDQGIEMQAALRKKMSAEVVNTYAGKDIMITVRSARKVRSTRQNRYYWGVVLPLILEGFIDAGNDLQTGNADHLDMIHQEMKRLHLDNGLDVVDAQGEVHRLPPSTRRCDVAEFMDYTDRVIRWAQDCLNVTIPEPGEQCSLPLDSAA